MSGRSRKRNTGGPRSLPLPPSDDPLKVTIFENLENGQEGRAEKLKMLSAEDGGGDSRKVSWRR